MAEEFNPYHVWLGIPLKDQPANYYRLLSLDIFETSGDVIDSAADRQMAHLRTFQSGKHGELTQRLLNEVAAARVCLLDAKKRAAYDQQLRAKLPPATTAAPSVASGSAIQRQPPRRPGPLPTVAQAPAPAANVPVAAALPQPANDWNDLLGNPAAKSASRSAGKSAGANAAKASAAKRAANNRNISIGIGVAVLLIAAAGIGWFALNGSSSEGTLVFDWPSDERAAATVTVDDVSLPAPASGAWEYHGPAGSHHVVALRPAYKIDANVTLTAGQKQTAPADWKPKAVLVLNWPLPQRAGAELKVDGRPHAVTQHDPLEIAVEPGLHAVQITRPNAAPIDRSATVAPEGRVQVAIAAPPPAATKLVFDWPADERKDAALIIDGSKQTVPSRSDSESFALVVAPGRRVVHLTRAGFEPFNKEIDLAAGANETVKPIWTPAQTVATTAPETTPADTQPAVETPAEQPAKKLQIPPAAEQEKVAKQLADLYKSSHAGSKDPAKAQELYDLAAKASSTERYVLLVKGAELAAAAGDVNLSLQGIDSLDGEFEIDVLEARQKLLDKFVNSGKPEQVDAAIPIAEQLMDQAIAADKFALATAFSMIASRAATKSKSPTRKEIDDRLSHRRHDIHVLETFFAAAKTAQETLVKNPVDAEANLNLGRWLCFYKGDWTAGLPLLAEGSDEKLKALAEQEAKTPTDAEQQAHLADAWWDLASKESGIARDSIHLHAGEIYQAASPNLTSALRKAAIEKRLAEIATISRGVSTVATNRPPSAVKPAASLRFHLNEWTDVLRIVDPNRDTVSGAWSRSGATISCEPGNFTRLALPVNLDGSYDLEVEFTRTDGQGNIDTIFPVGSHRCNAELSGSDSEGGKVSGLAKIDGREAGMSGNPTILRPGTLENDHRYTLVVSVRLHSGHTASVDVSLDGKPYLPHWAGNEDSLSVNGAWDIPGSTRPGLGAFGSRVAFHSVRLRMVSGAASLDPAVAESLAPQPGAATVRLNNPAGAADVPKNQWVDLLRLVDTAKNVVAGDWSRRGKEIDVGNNGAARLALPAAINGSYELEVTFTRRTDEGEIRIQIPVGAYSCDIEWGMQSRLSGLSDVSGYNIGDAQNPARVTSSDLVNGRVYRLGAKVRMLGADRASIDVFLDGKQFLPHWEGAPSSLSVPDTWRIQPRDHIGLGVWASQATFSAVRLRVVSGHATLDGSVAEPAAQGSSPVTAPPNKPAGEAPTNRWADVLKQVDLARDQISGTWQRSRTGVSCEPGDNVQLKLPAAPPGSYDLEIEFTRTANDGDVLTFFTAGSHMAMVALSAHRGALSGLQTIDGLLAEDPKNPIVKRPGNLENGHRYKLLLSVRLLSGDRGSIDVSLDGTPYLPHWEGSLASLALPSNFAESTPPQLTLGAWQASTTFHSVRLRPVKKGEAVPRDPATPNAADGPVGATKFPLNQWVDVLRLVHTTRDRVTGTWTRRSGQLICEPGNYSRIETPVIIDGGYDLDLEFTRSMGNDDIETMLSIGSHDFNVSLSGFAGDSSGLWMVNGLRANDPQNPTSVRPGALENGHRYRVLINARVLADNRGSFDLSLDGKRDLPHWEGNLAALSPAENQIWKMPNPRGLGFGAFQGHVTFHSIRLRMVSGHASLDTAVAESSAPGQAADSTSASKTELPPAKGAQLQFTKWIYEADEEGRPGFFQKDDAGWTETKAGKVWSHYKETARTDDYVEIRDPARNVWVRLSQSEAKWSKNRSGWQLIGKGKPAAE